MNGDPDVDAIYRLTRKNYKKPLDIEFDSNTPPLVLRRMQYAPFNSQNTFFHYEAFWSLIFPMSFSFRECDIIRSYVTIRLLNEIDGRVAFMPPNAVQVRNAHSYFKDFKDEARIFNDIDELVVALNSWKCNKSEFKECFISCIQHLISESLRTLLFHCLGNIKSFLCIKVTKLFDKEEENFYKQWVEDLDKLNYKWPKLVNRDSSSSIEQTPIILFKSVEQLQSSNSNENQKSLEHLKQLSFQLDHIEDTCQLKVKAIKPCKFENLVLIASANSDQDLAYMSSVVYPYFPYLVACYPNANTTIEYSFSVVKLSFKECIETAFKIGFRQQRFLIVKNITAFQFWNLGNLSIEKTSSNDSDTVNFKQLNVANGNGILNFTLQPNISLCNIYKSGKYKSLPKN